MFIRKFEKGHLYAWLVYKIFILQYDSKIPSIEGKYPQLRVLVKLSKGNGKGND